MTHKALIKRLETTCFGLDPVDPLRLLVDDVIAALREKAMREVQRLGQEIEQCTYPNCDYPCMKLPDCREQDHIPDARKMVTEQEPDIYPEEAYEMGLEAIAYYTTPPQRPRVVFPTMLRKMWSGGEVQAWLDENVNKENT
jgi:hypothetical protein